MPHGGHALAIDLLVGFQIVQRTASTPGPRTYSSPIVRRRLRLAWLEEQRTNAILEATVEIGLDITIVNRGEAVTTIENLVELPAAGRRAARTFQSAPFGLEFNVPDFRETDGRIGCNRMIAVEVQAEKHRHGFFGRRRHVEQKIHFRPVLLA